MRLTKVNAIYLMFKIFAHWHSFKLLEDRYSLISASMNGEVPVGAQEHSGEHPSPACP